MSRTIVWIALLLAMLLLLLATVVATIVSVPLTLGFLAWATGTFAIASLSYKKKHDTLVAAFGASSAVGAIALGTLTPGASSIMLPTGALFALAALAEVLAIRRRTGT